MLVVLYHSLSVLGERMSGVRVEVGWRFGGMRVGENNYFWELV